MKLKKKWYCVLTFKSIYYLKIRIKINIKCIIINNK